MRNLLLTFAVIWIGGAIVGRTTGIDTIFYISVNLFGSLTILLGVFMAGRWAWRKIARSRTPEASGAD